MNAPVYLNHDESSRFMASVTRAANWNEFLIKNVFGLTPGLQPIPVKHHKYDFLFNIKDLKALAYDFGAGTITCSHIEQKVEQFMKTLETKSSLIDRATGEILGKDDPFEAFEEPTKSERYCKATNDIALFAKALLSIQLALATIGRSVTPMPERFAEEIEALRAVTENCREQAYRIVDDLDCLHDELFDEEEFDEIPISDTEIHQLMAALEGAQ